LLLISRWGSKVHTKERQRAEHWGYGTLPSQATPLLHCMVGDLENLTDLAKISLDNWGTLRQSYIIPVFQLDFVHAVHFNYLSNSNTFFLLMHNVKRNVQMQ